MTESDISALRARLDMNRRLAVRMVNWITGTRTPIVTWMPTRRSKSHEH